MTVSVQPSTAGIDIVKVGVVAEPATQSGPHRDMVAFNLRRNFNAINPHQSGYAFNYTGHVALTVAPGDTGTNLTFGFIQFMKQMEWKYTYGGRSDSDGQVEIDPLPLIGTRYLIDREPVTGASFSPLAQDPWNTSHVDLYVKEAVANIGDHPVAIVPAKVRNSRTGNDNLLYSVVDVRKFVSIFVVGDPLGHYTPLAHVTTDLAYRGLFRWVGNSAIPAVNLSSFTPAPVVVGAPTDPEVVGLIAKLRPDMSPVYNVEADQAAKNAAVQGNPCRRDINNYGVFISPAFFMP